MCAFKSYAGPTICDNRVYIVTIGFLLKYVVKQLSQISVLFSMLKKNRTKEFLYIDYSLRYPISLMAKFTFDECL